MLLPCAPSLIKDTRRILEPLVLQQPLDQVVPRVVERLFDLIAVREHQTRLDFDQRAGDFQEIAHRVDVDLLEHRQIIEELCRDLGDRYLDHLHLVLAHQVQQEIQRTPERVEIDAEAHGRLRS